MFQSLFDLQARLDKVSDNDDPLTAINQVVPWEMFRVDLERIGDDGQARQKHGRAQALYDRVLLFKMLILQSLYNLSDDQLEQQTLDRLSFHRFLGLNMGDRVPDSKTVWLFRESLNRDDRARRLFEKFESYLTLKGLSVFKTRSTRLMEAKAAPRAATKNQFNLKQPLNCKKSDMIFNNEAFAFKPEVQNLIVRGSLKMYTYFVSRRHLLRLA